MKIILQSLLATCLIYGTTLAQNPGDLDLNFGISGYSLTDPIANTGEKYQNLITLSDDKVIMVGYTDDGGDFDIIVAKLLADGTPDSTFGNNGFVVIDLSLGQNDNCYDAYELPDGKLLLTGYVQTPTSYEGYVMRMNTDGSIDNSFGTSSGHSKFNVGDNTSAVGRKIEVVGTEIYVGGSAVFGSDWRPILVNFTQGGGIDISFSSSGFANIDLGSSTFAYEMSRNSNGEFILAGVTDNNGPQDGFVSKLSSFGTPTSFATGGTYTFDLGSGLNEVRGLFIDSNDKIVLAITDGTGVDLDGFVMRINNDGTIDATFATNGIIGSNPGATTSLVLRNVMDDGNGGIIASGYMSSAASKEVYAMFLTSTGGLNGSYGGNGDVNISFAISVNSVITTGAARQSDGKIVLGGYLTSQDFTGENMFAMRLYPDNLSVNEIEKKEFKVYPNPVTNQFVIDSKDVVHVQLTNIRGEVIKTWGKEDLYKLPSFVSSGVYILRIETKNSLGTSRIVIK